MELIHKGTHWDFIGKWPVAILLSIALTIGSIWIWIDLKEAKYGVDFRGGHDIVVKVTGEGSSEKIRQSLESQDIKEAIVQSFESGSNQYSIRLGGEKAEGAAELDNAKVVRAKVQAALVKTFGDKVEVLKTDYVGPTVGKELRSRAVWATIFGLLGILVYLTFRFEFAFALGAVVAVFHDVFISTGFYLYSGYQINMGTIAAALTIVGYSVHDTIVIFDRVREEIYKRKDFNLADLMNESINATMSRTIITTLLTLFSVVALLLLGGGSISDLSFYLFVGIVCGTYSTVYIASPVVLAWDYLRNRKFRSAQQPA
jgi:preprotein translocase subunit SecF